MLWHTCQSPKFSMRETPLMLRSGHGGPFDIIVFGSTPGPLSSVLRKAWVAVLYSSLPFSSGTIFALSGSGSVLQVDLRGTGRVNERRR